MLRGFELVGLVGLELSAVSLHVDLKRQKTPQNRAFLFLALAVVHA